MTYTRPLPRRLEAVCWCQRKTVWVWDTDVRDGRTGTCGAPGCAPVVVLETRVSLADLKPGDRFRWRGRWVTFASLEADRWFTGRVRFLRVTAHDGHLERLLSYLPDETVARREERPI